MGSRMPHGISAFLRILVVGLFAGLLASASSGQEFPEVDTALVLAVDVSNSVNPQNYKLQMEGIATALEDQDVIDTIARGPLGGIYLSVVTWSKEAEVIVPWTRLSGAQSAKELGRRLRAIPRKWVGGEATCLGSMLDTLEQTLIAEIRGKAFRTVVDVSGDGRDNCSPPGGVRASRDRLVAGGVTINGLPILQGGDSNDHATVAGWRLNRGEAALIGAELEAWYEANVRGGPGSFIIPAQGFADFARAFRSKFLTEISGDLPVRHLASDASTRRR